jgi:signal transduction histidine kinase/ligand-binding sensor domain-containing protein/DNA-binding response OmpR family regulator
MISKFLKKTGLPTLLRGLVLYLFFLKNVMVSAQTSDFIFESLPPRSDIGPSTINAMLQDKQGFLWFGTWSGLWRYDAYTFRPFGAEAGLNSSKITCLFEASDGALWVGTRNTGLYRFDRGREIFEPAAAVLPADNTLEAQNITSVFRDREGRYWIGAEEGLWLYDPEKRHFFAIPLQGITPPPSENIYLYTICQTLDGSIWVAGSHGLYRGPAKNGAVPVFHQIVLHPANATVRDIEYHNFVYTACAVKSGQDALWIGTKQGLKLLDISPEAVSGTQPAPGSIRYFEYHESDPGSLSHNFAIGVCEGNFPHPNAVWVATFNGLNLLDIATGRFKRFFAKDDHSGSLQANNVRSLLFDKSGILWIGTNRGVNKLNPRYADFQLHAMRRNGNTADEAVSFLSKSADNIWVSSFGGGIFRVPMRGDKALWQQAKHYALMPDAKSPVANFVSAVLPDNRGNLWCLTQGAGVFQVQEKDVPPGGGLIGRSRQYSKGAGMMQTGDDYIMSGLVRSDGKIWLGCWDAGLNLIDPDQQRILKFTKTSDGKVDFHLFPIVALAETVENGQTLLWVGTRGGGLFQVAYDASTGAATLVRHFHRQGEGADHLAGNFITSILLDEQSHFWVTTENGIFLKRQGKPTFEPVVLKNVPSALHFEAIVPVGDARFWVSTQKGLGFFSMQEPLPTAIFYENRNGLRERFFNSSAMLFLPSGEVLLGGSIGITSFQPKQVQPDLNPPAPVITGLRLFNRPVLPGIPTDEGFVLEKSLSTLPQLVLSYRDNVVSFEFSGLHFSCPEQNVFAYKLEGFDPEWLYTDASQRLAHYTNLPPGEYRFLVKTANSDGVWNEQPAQLSVRVRPPWWQTSWAYTLYIALFIGLLGLVRQLTLLRANYENKIALERLEKQKLEEVNQMKLIFFTNISHELKTPLTLILTPLEEIIRNRTAGNNVLHNTFSMMHRNARRLLTMINQLLDIRKAEAGLMKLEVGEGNIVQFVGEVCLSFRELAQQRQIQFDFQTNSPAITAWFDPDQLEKVFFNILSNAFKYTPPGGKVVVEMGEHADTKQYFIRVQDNGMGIPEDKLPFIFERFFRVESSGETGDEGGTGIGLSLVKNIVERHHGSIVVESDPGKGSVFTVWLPLAENSFSPHEKKRATVHGEEMTHYPPMLPGDVPEAESAVVPPTNEAAEKPTLLLVEDNPDIRTYLVRNLSATYLVVEAEDGAQGLQKTLENLPDLILCDISMPGMDGLELTRQLKSRVETSHIPIVLLTARTSLIFKIDGLETGADDYITKPFNLQLLQIRIRNLIASRRRLREQFARSMQQSDNQTEEVVLPKMDEDFIKSVMDIIENNLEDPDFSVDDLSKQLLLNRKQIYRKIKALTDHTPNEFIRNMRLKKAAQLLKTNRFTVAEVTYKVGFQDLKYFRERFRAYFGVNPSDLENR